MSGVIKEMDVSTFFTWTNNKPTEEGWYWYTGKNWSRSICIEVFRDAHMWCASETRLDKRQWQAIDNMDGQWAGPIPDPAY